MPSHLQSELTSQRLRLPDICIENWGRRGATFWNRVLWASELDSCDLNIFLVGVNDCGASFLANSDYGGSTALAMLQRLDEIAGTRLHLVGLVSRPFLTALLSRPLSEARSAYADALGDLRSRLSDSPTLIILQPSLYWHPRAQDSKTHRSRVGNSLAFLPSRLLELRNYDWIDTTTRNDSRTSFLDLRHCLDQSPADFYLDRCHLRAAGNRELARAIVKNLDLQMFRRK